MILITGYLQDGKETHCFYCHKTVPSGTFPNHISEHHTNGEKPFPCHYNFSGVGCEFGDMTNDSFEFCPRCLKPMKHDANDEYHRYCDNGHKRFDILKA